jgi:hypothetical protein
LDKKDMDALAKRSSHLFNIKQIATLLHVFHSNINDKTDPSLSEIKSQMPRARMQKIINFYGDGSRRQTQLTADSLRSKVRVLLKQIAKFCGGRLIPPHVMDL